MRYYFFNHKTNTLDDLGEFTTWRAAYATIADVQSGSVWGEEMLRQYATDPRHRGGIKLENPLTRTTYRIIENENGKLSLEAVQFPRPPERFPKFIGD